MVWYVTRSVSSSSLPLRPPRKQSLVLWHPIHLFMGYGMNLGGAVKCKAQGPFPHLRLLGIWCRHPYFHTQIGGWCGQYHITWLLMNFSLVPPFRLDWPLCWVHFFFKFFVQNVCKLSLWAPTQRLGMLATGLPHLCRAWLTVTWLLPHMHSDAENLCWTCDIDDIWVCCVFFTTCDIP